MTKKPQPTEGDLQVWWCPQIPMPSFNVSVEDVDQAMLLLETLAKYDLFQFENSVKPDYCNVGGLSVWENGEWIAWENDDGDTIDELMREKALESEA